MKPGDLCMIASGTVLFTAYGCDPVGVAVGDMYALWIGADESGNVDRSAWCVVLCDGRLVTVFNERCSAYV